MQIFSNHAKGGKHLRYLLNLLDLKFISMQIRQIKQIFAMHRMDYLCVSVLSVGYLFLILKELIELLNFIGVICNMRRKIVRIGRS